MTQFHSRAAERHANIIVAEIRGVDPRGTLFPELARLPDGTVIAESSAGVLRHLKWSVDHQRIDVLEVRTPTQGGVLDLYVVAA